MASPNSDSTIPKNEALVNAIQLSLRPRVKSNQRESATRQAEERSSCPDVPHMIHELEIDLNRPLKYALESIFKNGAKVVLTFPGASHAQVSHWLHAL